MVKQMYSRGLEKKNKNPLTIIIYNQCQQWTDSTTVINDYILLMVYTVLIKIF